MVVDHVSADFSSRTDVLFFFNDTATTEIYTLSLHDALPISYLRRAGLLGRVRFLVGDALGQLRATRGKFDLIRSEEHTSELQSRQYLVCRLLLEKKNQQSKISIVDETEKEREE